MKTKLKTTAFVAILLLLVPFFAIGQERTLSWDYPVKPGMEEWKKLKGVEARIKACQIPEDILYSLSTEELMDLCLRYPFIYDIFAFNSLEHGFDQLFNNFNGIRELYKRVDVASHLTKRYAQQVQLFSYLDGNHTDAQKGLFMISVSILEILLSRIEYSENSKDILQNLMVGYEKKKHYAEYFKGLGFQTNLFSRGHVIIKMEKSLTEKLPQERRDSLFFSGRLDEESVNLINELSYQLIQ